ncbi:MAG: hypothetical protein GTN36_00790 [Candidatus Aenigmarchaeota archaeon]|nr:hypothetical protein [Candidatus Aenigmarchaeota archaeon]
MNHNHLKNLINLGFLVDEKIADKIEALSEEELYNLVEILKKENVFIINEENLRSVLVGDVKILRIFKKTEKFTVQDFVKNLNNRYTFLQDVLMKKLKLSNIVSINKGNVGNLTIIGLVKEKQEKDNNFVISLEDSTGEIKTLATKKLGERVNLDDVIAVSGRVTNKILFIDKLLFPDVPLKPVVYSREPVKIVLSDKKGLKTDYLILNNKIKDKIKNKEYEITNPCIFKINNVVILLILGYDPLDVLKKRYVNIENTDFLIKPSPDIVLTDKEINTNYKGISIVSKNKVIDLKTREVSDI